MAAEDGADGEGDGRPACLLCTQSLSAPAGRRPESAAVTAVSATLFLFLQV